MKFQITCLIAIIIIFDDLQVVNSHSVQPLLRGRGVPDFSFEEQALMASERQGQGAEVLPTPSFYSTLSVTNQPETHEHDVISRRTV